MSFTTIRLVCSGGRRCGHPTKELFVLHRRRRRLSPEEWLSIYRPVTSEWPALTSTGGLVEMDVTPTVEEFVPGWDAQTSIYEYDGVERRSRAKTPVVITDSAAGDQLVTVPACPRCNRGGNGLKLSTRRLEEAAGAMNGKPIDLAMFVT